MRVEAEDLSTGELLAAFRRRDAGVVRAIYREYPETKVNSVFRD